MQRQLELHDIQGNVTRAYGRYRFPLGRYFFLHIGDAKAGRQFVDDIRHRVTTAARWKEGERPDVTLNIGFTFFGLYALGLPTRTLRAMPPEFIDGMKARAHVLGDRSVDLVEDSDGSWCAHWDPIWRENRHRDPGKDVHAWISMNAQAKPGSDQPVDALEQQTEWLRDRCNQTAGGVTILAANGASGDAEFQSGKALFVTLPDGTKVPTAREHFGFTDGIGDPVYDGQYPDDDMRRRVVGRGKFMDHETGWQPIAAGEFVLGYPDEAQELTPMAVPFSFARNGSFMVYRKLHQNVGSFRDVVAEDAKIFARVMGVDEAEAEVTLKAKIVGRWPDGVPLAKQPTFAEWQAFRAERGFDDPDPLKAAEAQYAYLKSSEPSDFRYADDIPGYKCPNGAHLRRSNPRDYLDPLNQPDAPNPNATTQLNKRRRILRRGLPYGDAGLGEGDDATEQGVIFMAIGTSLFRQFEFVQQQWLEYGLDFNLGNDTCPLLGDHSTHKRHVIPSDPNSGKPPFVMGNLRTFVETRGGDYFFLPSMTALRMIAMGSTDPT
ncbi:MAG: peroxidase [Pseudomonadota bacterium]